MLNNGYALVMITETMTAEAILVFKNKMLYFLILLKIGYIYWKVELDMNVVAIII